MLCYFYICIQLTGSRYGGVKQLCWANYLFPGLEDKKKRGIGRLEVVPDEKILERISQSVGSYTTESNEDAFKPDTVFESFHHQARTPISDRALLADFFNAMVKEMCGSHYAPRGHFD